MREPEITMIIRVFQQKADYDLLKYSLIIMANLCTNPKNFKIFIRKNVLDMLAATLELENLEFTPWVAHSLSGLSRDRSIKI